MLNEILLNDSFTRLLVKLSIFLIGLVLLYYVFWAILYLIGGILIIAVLISAGSRPGPAVNSDAYFIEKKLDDIEKKL
jgi:hypothetical protein